jgi:hypothetical protein
MKIRFFFPDDNQKIQILSALNLISSQTCIKFVQLFPGFNEEAYVLIRSGGGCSSEVGYRAGEIQMSLNIEVSVELLKMVQGVNKAFSCRCQGCLDVGESNHD